MQRPERVSKAIANRRITRYFDKVSSALHPVQRTLSNLALSMEESEEKRNLIDAMSASLDGRDKFLIDSEKRRPNSRSVRSRLKVKDEPKKEVEKKIKSVQLRLNKNKLNFPVKKDTDTRSKAKGKDKRKGESSNEDFFEAHPEKLEALPPAVRDGIKMNLSAISDVTPSQVSSPSIRRPHMLARPISVTSDEQGRSDFALVTPTSAERYQGVSEEFTNIMMLHRQILHHFVRSRSVRYNKQLAKGRTGGGKKSMINTVGGRNRVLSSVTKKSSAVVMESRMSRVITMHQERADWAKLERQMSLATEKLSGIRARKSRPASEEGDWREDSEEEEEEQEVQHITQGGDVPEAHLEPGQLDFMLSFRLKEDRFVGMKR